MPGRSSRRLRHHAGYLLLRGLLAAGGALPLSLLRPIGRTLGGAALSLSRRERDRARDHLRIAWPELARGEHDRLLAASARHLGLMLAEVDWLWHATPEQVLELAPMTGGEHLERVRADGRGAVLITGHVGNWELLNARLCAGGVPMTIAVRELDDPRLDAAALRLRARHGAEVVPRGDGAGRRLLAALRANRVVGLLIDQDIADIPGVFVPFFGRPAWTPSGAATIAVRTGRPMVPAFIHRLPDHRHQAEVLPPLEVPEEGSVEERAERLTAAATAAIEARIRRHPEQWVWSHRRWRTLPPGG